MKIIADWFSYIHRRCLLLVVLLITSHKGPVNKIPKSTLPLNGGIRHEFCLNRSQSEFDTAIEKAIKQLVFKLKESDMHTHLTGQIGFVGHRNMLSFLFPRAFSPQGDCGGGSRVVIF